MAARTGERLRVLVAASEATPLMKTGGLGDVAGALPAALRALRVDARLLLPGYPGVLSSLALTSLATRVPLLSRQPPADILEGELPDGTPLLALRHPLFDRPGNPYLDPAGVDWPDNHLRFGLLARAAALFAGADTPLAWRPQVLHLNDWQTALAAAWLALDSRPRARTLLSIHNMAFAGAFDAGTLSELDLPDACYSMHGVEFYGRVSFLKAGIYYADRIATVSPGYAREIQTEDFGGGLHGLLQTRRHHLYGILNGIDAKTWNPRADPHISRRYGAATLARKATNRRALQQEMGLEPDADAALFGMITRLTWQKGVDLVPDALRALPEQAWQLVLLGSGDQVLQAQFQTFERAHPGRVRVAIGYDEPLAHRIEAGSDLFLMPSRFEPCGLNQMYSMRYGTPPVVRRTGGLADSVVDTDEADIVDDAATGFVFGPTDSTALAVTLRRALRTRANPDAWHAMRRAGMMRDFSWKRSAREYVALYRRMIEEAASPT